MRCGSHHQRGKERQDLRTPGFETLLSEGREYAGAHPREAESFEPEVSFSEEPSRMLPRRPDRRPFPLLREIFEERSIPGRDGTGRALDMASTVSATAMIRFGQDLGPGKSLWIAGAIHPFVMLQDGF